MMTVGSLFAGIGGFDLGFQRAGYKIVWQVEKDPWCRMILARHFPKADRFGDIRKVGAQQLEYVDVICGGFPCQDVSPTNTRFKGGLRGLSGKESGLWREFWRVVCEIYPRWVVIENVDALSLRGLPEILQDLAQDGFNADWAVIPASGLGAPHHRERLYIVGQRAIRFVHEMSVCECCGEEPYCDECQQHWGECPHPSMDSWQELLSDPGGQRLQRDESFLLAQPETWRQNPQSAGPNRWSATPKICRGADGIPKRVDKLRALGNAVVPQVAEFIARRILEEADRQSKGELPYANTQPSDEGDAG